MKLLLRTVLIVFALLAITTCKKADLTEDLPTPQISFGTAATIPAAGTGDGLLSVTLTNSEYYEIELLCDGEVISSALYRAPDIIAFTASANNSYNQRTGWIEMHCGDVSRRIELTQAAGDTLPAIDGKSGWFELPAKPYDDNLICYAHDRLPSNGALRNYSFCFAPEHCASLWVAYPLHECYLGTGRKDSFGYDYAFAEYTSSLNLRGAEIQANVARAYYTGDGVQYDRGHQLPSADRNRTEDDNRTTFYATNMTPQHGNINQKMWRILEDKVRDWVCADTLYVVTGAYFGTTHGYAYDNGGIDKGGKAVSLPTHYYKALLRTKDGSTGKRIVDCTADELKCIAFWVEHDITRSGTTVYTTDACSVAELERLTGETFFVNVPAAPKSLCNTDDWPGLTRP